MKLNCPLLLNMPSKKNQQNYGSFYPSQPFKYGHFNVRHPVLCLVMWCKYFAKCALLMPLFSGFSLFTWLTCLFSSWLIMWHPFDTEASVNITLSFIRSICKTSQIFKRDTFSHLNSKDMSVIHS